MNIKNKFLLSFCLIFLIGAMYGCGLTKQYINTNNNHENIYNNNEKIVQEGDNYTYTNSRNNLKDNKIEIKYSGFSGIDTVYVLEAKEDTEITLDYNSTVDKGNFKEVLINPKNEVETILEGTGQSSKTIKLTKGKYSFRDVGVRADGKLEISINNNTNVEIIQDKK